MYAHAIDEATQIEDSFDFEGMMDAAREHAMLSQRIQERIQDTIQIEYSFWKKLEDQQM